MIVDQKTKSEDTFHSMSSHFLIDPRDKQKLDKENVVIYPIGDYYLNLNRASSSYK